MRALAARALHPLVLASLGLTLPLAALWAQIPPAASSTGSSSWTRSVARADDPPMLHEYVPDLASEEGTLLVSSDGAVPEAIVYRGEVLPAPELTGRGRDEPSMLAAPGDGERTEEPGRRSPTFSPDRVTDLDGTVRYYTVFNPTIAPFKRVTALDVVTLDADGTPVLAIGDLRRTPIGVAGVGAEPPDARARDRFWGSVVLDFREGALVPLPGVGPEARILTLESSPSVTLQLSRDGADNVYASLVGGPVGGGPTMRPSGQEVRVRFLTDAPRSYFGQNIPDGPVGAHGAKVRPLPATVQRDADVFAAELGLSRSSTFAEALFALTAHFRSFEESSQPPEDTGNIYLDLSRGLRGICRHRAYGFVITAQALGMHARFVQNEAHAWVEVELPGEAGWLRVDLGGAATGLDARDAENRAVYRPEVPDRLPRPPAYERAYAEAARAAGGTGAGASGGGASQTSASGTGGASGPTSGGSGPGGAGGMSVAAAPSTGRRAPLSLALDQGSFEVFRGRELEVTGRTSGGGEGVPGLRVEVLLASAQGVAEHLLGVTVSRDNGRFRGVFGVPPDLPVGEYRLLVRTPGDARWSAARAN